MKHISGVLVCVFCGSREVTSLKPVNINTGLVVDSLDAGMPTCVDCGETEVIDRLEWLAKQRQDEAMDG